MLTYVGRNQDDRAVLDLSQVVSDLAPMLAVAAGGNHTIRFHHHADSVLILGNESALQQCMMNLVHNSLDAVRDHGGKIDVRTDYLSLGDSEADWRVFGDPPPGRYGIVEVEDDGGGMLPEVLERAFDPYFTTKKTGNGFGLATTLGIVCGYRGGVRCQTQPGVGTRIQLLFPTTAGVVPVRASKRPATPARSSRILLVDDEQLVRSAVTRLLQRAGYAVTAVPSGEAALSRVRGSGHDFDVALIDYAMPEMNGLELLGSLRTIGFVGRAILCSGYAEVELATNDAPQPDAILTKPYRLADVQRALTAAPQE